MRQQQLFAIATCLCSFTVLLVSAVPVPANDQELDVLQIPLSDDKELDVLTLSAKDQEQLIAERNKRTIGLLRELFPDITKQIDDIVNRIIGQVIRVAGPSLLPALLGNNRPTTESSDFDADFDDDDDSNSDANSQENTNSVFSKANAGTPAPSVSNENGATRVSIVLPTFPPASEGTPATTASAAKNGATDTQIDLSAINKQLEETIRVARQVKEAEAAAQAIAEQQQQQTPSSLPAQLPIPSKTDLNAPIQLSFSNEIGPLSSTPDSSKPVNNDLRSTESKSPALDELTLDSNEDAADLDDRNKRFLSFGGAGVAGGSSGSSGNTGNAAAGGGSGNFLFDIIRLFSGSVQTQTGDEAANSANSVSGGGDADGDSDANRAADGFTEGIPGPVTRLVVLANRGLANLIQDLILRIAATSEKFVNFKAKLITALI